MIIKMIIQTIVFDNLERMHNDDVAHAATVGTSS